MKKYKNIREMYQIVKEFQDLVNYIVLEHQTSLLSYYIGEDSLPIVPPYLRISKNEDTVYLNTGKGFYKIVEDHGEESKDGFKVIKNTIVQKNV
jgi:hypothetical protein